jgi:hypothetical protein
MPEYDMWMMVIEMRAFYTSLAELILPVVGLLSVVPGNFISDMACKTSGCLCVSA